MLQCWGDLPRPRAMVLPLYSKLIVQFQELVEIIDINYPFAYKGGGGGKGAMSTPYKIGKGVVNLRSQTNKM